jgi:ATP-dependent RNA helicase DeaD
MRFLRNLERVNRSTLEEIFMPTAKDLSAGRIAKFKARIMGALEKNKSLEQYGQVIAQLQEETELSTEQLLAALTLISQDSKTLFPQEIQIRQERTPRERDSRSDSRSDSRGGRTNDRRDSRSGDRRDSRSGDRDNRNSGDRSERQARPRRSVDVDMKTYKLEVGRDNDVAPRNIVGAIANEGGIDSKNICNISIQNDHTLVDLPASIDAKTIGHLKNVWVSGKKLNIKEV